jgi:hypothetical protein
MAFELCRVMEQGYCSMGLEEKDRKNDRNQGIIMVGGPSTRTPIVGGFVDISPAKALQRGHLRFRLHRRPLLFGNANTLHGELYTISSAWCAPPAAHCGIGKLQYVQWGKQDDVCWRQAKNL